MPCDLPKFGASFVKSKAKYDYMDWGIDNIKDFLEVISFLATIVGGIAIVLAARDYSVSRKQLHLSVLESCIIRFREDFSDLTPDSPIEQIRAYIDLVNEELFYFEHKYLPAEVAEEWLDGMINIIPIFDRKGKVINPNHCFQAILDHKLLDKYAFRRVKRIFTIANVPQMDKVYGDTVADIDIDARAALVEELILNFTFPKK